ncbi:TAXI family TRAP transporter solute-binding subunit [Pararhizobium haloflavum]|uniref:TAXI family TRAP transporter solute-binding subunit n=1 Tax=Pararhizobium haloflavum TaxID=2037914 RepID=UPI000C199C92|nr:TAXI family TRAP transporter solute-binding subunit [Pararhizobium haloflavum]
MKRNTTLLLACGLVAALAAPATAQQRLTMGGTHSSSSFYAYQVGISNYLSNTIDDISINISELGGAEVSTEALLRDEIDMGIAVTSSDFAAVEGEAPFSAPADTLRTLFFFAPLPLNFVVAADSEVESIADLAGVSFNPGGRGTSTEAQVENIFASIEIEPELMIAEGNDALEAYQNRNIQGFVKGGLHPDGYIQQAHSSRPIRILSFDADQVSAVTEAFPYFSGTTTDAGDNYGDAASGSYETIQTAIGINTTTNLDEETAYQIAKAVFSEEGKQAATDVYPPAAQVDAVELTLSAAVAPLHAGVVRYLEEIGADIPDRLIAE